MKKVILLLTICFLLIACNFEIANNPNIGSFDELVGIRVKQAPTQMMYFVNEKLNLSGLVVNAVYSDGTEKEIEGYTISPVNGTVLNEEGSIDITISYYDHSCNFSIVVYEDGHSFEDIYTKGYIGRTINLLTAENFVPDTRFTPIFDFDKLYKIKPNPKHIGSQKTETISGENIQDLLLKIKAALNKKINNGVNLSVIGIPMMMNFGLEASIEDQYESSYKTKEYYCHSTYLLEEEEIGLEGYSNIRAFTQYLSEEFKEDASSVAIGMMTPKTFIEKYGTNVLMASVIGASYNATYHVSTSNSTIKNEFNSKFQSKFEASLFDLAGKESEKGLDLSILCNQDTKDTASYFKAEAVGGGVFSFTTGEGASKGFNQWANSVNSSNLSVISIPDESLYFVWDLLDDSYSEAKRILYNYFITECEILNDEFIRAAKKYQTKDSFTFDEINQIATCELGYFYDDPLGEDFNYGFYEDGVLTIMPKYNHIPVIKVIIKGQYGVENSNGIVLDEIINGLSIKMSESFNTDKVEIILENVGLIGKNGVPAIDLTGCTNINEIVIKFKGKTFISSENESAPVIKSDCKLTVITSEGEEDLVELCGANGSSSSLEGGDAVVAKRLTINEINDLRIFGGSGYKGKNVATDKSDTGLANNGGTAITCDAITVSGVKGIIRGGDGGNGIKSNSIYSNGSNGGNGGSSIIANSVRLSNTSIQFIAGDGGNGGGGYDGQNGQISFHSPNPVEAENGTNGGNGGIGAKAIDSSSIYGLSTYDVVTNGKGGRGGRGGKGGDGAIHDGGCVLVLKPNWWQGINAGYGGNGGKGGDGYGSAGEGGDLGTSGARGYIYNHSWDRGTYYGNYGIDGSKGASGELL